MYDRRYWKEYALWSAAWLATVLGMSKLIGELPDDSPLRLLLLLPMLVVVAGGFWIEVRQMRRFDEMQRQIYLEAMLMSVMFAIGYSVSLLLLEAYAKWPPQSAIWILVALSSGFFLGLVMARRRYR